MSREIYDSARDSIINFLSQLHQMNLEGKTIPGLEEETWKQLEELIEFDSDKRKHIIRQQIKEIEMGKN